MVFIILLSSILGFLVSAHIWRSKKKGERLSCAIGRKDSCDIVVKSKYNAILGVPNEVGGMAYYGFAAIVAGVMLADGAPNGALFLVMPFLAASVLPALFSIALIAIQVFVIRKWCEWCMVSAILSVVIFAFAMALFAK